MQDEDNKIKEDNTERVFVDSKINSLSTLPYFKSLCSRNELDTGPECTEISDNLGFSWVPPLQNYLGLSDISYQENENYLVRLKSDSVFLNPNGLSLMTNAYGTNSYEYIGRIASDNSEDWNYESLRSRQNLSWADDYVKKGIDLAKSENYKDALKDYDQALSLFPNHVDALIAKGAALSNLGVSKYPMRIEVML